MPGIYQAQDTDLTTLAFVKEFLRITNTNSDALLQDLIAAKSADFLARTYRAQLTPIATITETRDGKGGDTLMLQNSPIVAITSLTVDGVVVPAAVSYTGPGYFFDKNGKITLLASTLNQPTPTGGWYSYQFTRRRKNVVCTYTYGYSDLSSLPPDIVEAVATMVGYAFRQGDRVDQESNSIAGASTRYRKSYPDTVLATIEKYARRIWVTA